MKLEKLLHHAMIGSIIGICIVIAGKLIYAIL